jgi:hypothetical protein
LQPAHVFGLAELDERFVDGDHVGRLAGIDQADHLLEDDPVVVAVEIFRVHEVGNAVPRRIVAQQATDDGLFCFDGMRRNAERLDLRVCWGVHGRHYTCSPSAAEMIEI